MKQLKICVIGMVLISLLSGCSVASEEEYYEKKAEEFAKETVEVLHDKDFDKFIEMLDSFAVEKYQELTKDEQEEFKKDFYEISDLLNEVYRENWNKEVEYFDFNAVTVTVPGRTAIEGNIFVHIPQGDDGSSFMVEFVEENEQLFFRDGFWLLENVMNETESYNTYYKN